MSDEEMVDASAADVERVPPSLGTLVQLFSRPARYFERVDLDHALWYRSILLLWGIAYTSGRVDQNILRAELGQPRPGWEEFAPYLLESWVALWFLLAGAGALSAVFHWYVGGWWYRIRLRLSAATEPDAREARLVMTYAGLVAALPTVIALLIYTLVFPSYGAYWQSEEMLSSVLLLFPFWSVIVSYQGVRNRFEVAVWKSRLWFVILPILLYLVGLGALTLMFAFFGS